MKKVNLDNYQLKDLDSYQYKDVISPSFQEFKNRVVGLFFGTKLETTSNVLDEKVKTFLTDLQNTRESIPDSAIEAISAVIKIISDNYNNEVSSMGFSDPKNHEAWFGILSNISRSGSGQTHLRNQEKEFLTKLQKDYPDDFNTIQIRSYKSKIARALCWALHEIILKIKDVKVPIAANLGDAQKAFAVALKGSCQFEAERSQAQFKNNFSNLSVHAEAAFKSMFGSNYQEIIDSVVTLVDGYLHLHPDDIDRFAKTLVGIESFGSKVIAEPLEEGQRLVESAPLNLV